PYDYPENIAAGLSAGSYAPPTSYSVESQAATGTAVKTFVVGFSMRSGLGANGGLSCNDILTPSGGPYTGYHSSICGTAGQAVPTAYSAYTSCCQLAKIAAAGGTSVPYFADTASDLSETFSAILAIVLQNTTTRAVPVQTPQLALTTGSAITPGSSLFLSS